jgi:predicted transcriptional regulator
MEKKRVRDIMIPLKDYPHIYENQTLRQATREIRSSQIDVGERKSLPRMVLVFNRNDELVGGVRRRDILRGLEPTFGVSRALSKQKSLVGIEMDPNLLEMAYDRFANGIVQRGEIPVHDIMLPLDMRIDIDDHIVKAIYEMVESDLSMLPVMDKGRVAGVVRSVDVFQEIAKMFPEDPSNNARD